nr:hypothetical protein [Tanacetum cinerariifolium]
DIEYVEASLPDLEIVSIEEENGVEEENVVQREEEEVDLEDISQVQDVVLREKLFSITRIISNIESLNDNSTPDCVFNSFESNDSLLDNFLPEFETFYDHSEETRSGNTTHANYSFPEYDSFCFEIKPDQERLINLMENDNYDSSNDPLLEEADLFLSDNSIPPGIENVANDPEGDIHFLEELLIDDSILSDESSDSNFEDNPSNSRPPPELPDDNFDSELEVILVVMEDIDEPDEHFNQGGDIFVSTNNEDIDYFPFMCVIRIFLPYLILPEISPLLLSAESEDMIFDPVPLVYEQELSNNQNYDENYYPHESPSFPCCDKCRGSHETFQCQPMDQNVDFFGSDQIETPQYPEIHPPSQEISDEVFQAKGDLMKSIQTSLEEFNCIPFEEKPQILLQAWYKIFTIRHAQSEDLNELFQKLLEDLKEMVEYVNFPSRDRPIFSKNNEDHSDQSKESLENSSKEIATSNSNQEKEEPPQDSDIHQLIEECSTEVSEEQKQSMEDTMLELVKICRQKEFLCINDNVDDLIESALNTKLFSINSNSQRLDKEEVIHKNSISLNTSQISSIHAIAPILLTKEPEYSTSMGYENSNTTLETKSDEIMKFGVEELVPILSENEVTLEDKTECDVPISENSTISNDHSDIFSNSKIDDDISSDEDDFEDIEYVEASLFDPEIVSVEEENVVHQEEEEVDLEDISQIQDVVLREKLLSITHLISNIESLNDSPTPDCVNNSFESNNSFSDNFSPEFETFCDHTEETRSEEADLFLAFNNLIPSGIENVADDSEGDIYFLEELLIDDSILSHESSNSNFEDNPSFPRPPLEPPDAEFNVGKESPVVMNDKDEDVDYSSFIFVIYPKMFLLLLFAKSEDTIFDPGISV